MDLEDIFYKLFFKVAPESTCSLKIKSIYSKNQEDLTFREIAEYYACKSILNTKSINQDTPNYIFKKSVQNGAEVLRAISRMNLYGKNERTYDFPRG